MLQLVSYWVMIVVSVSTLLYQPSRHSILIREHSSQVDQETLAKIVAESPGAVRGRPGRPAKAATSSELLKPTAEHEGSSEDSDTGSSSSLEPESSEEESSNGSQEMPKAPTTSKSNSAAESKPPPSPPPPPPPSDGKKGDEELPPGWSGVEITMFRMLHPTFGHNYCAIAELLESKSCQEVFDHAQWVGPSALLSRGERGRHYRAKKKKRNMR